MKKSISFETKVPDKTGKDAEKLSNIYDVNNFEKPTELEAEYLRLLKEGVITDITSPFSSDYEGTILYRIKYSPKYKLIKGAKLLVINDSGKYEEAYYVGKKQKHILGLFINQV